jgi:hypothetical protein
MKPKHPPGDPMTLGNMRALGVRNLVAACLNDLAEYHRCGVNCGVGEVTPWQYLEARNKDLPTG